MWCWIHPKYITCSQFYHPKTGSFSALSAFALEFGVPEWLGFLNHPLIWGCHIWKSSNVCWILSSLVTWVQKTQPAYNKLVGNAWLPNFGACHVFTPKDFQNIPELGATFHHFPGRWAARFNPYVSEARWKKRKRPKSFPLEWLFWEVTPLTNKNWWVNSRNDALSGWFFSNKQRIFWANQRFSFVVVARISGSKWTMSLNILSAPVDGSSRGGPMVPILWTSRVSQVMKNSLQIQFEGISSQWVSIRVCLKIVYP